MEFGLHIFATESSIQPRELAKESEARGFGMLLFSEHTHIPVNFLENDEDGQQLPSYYWQAYDPFIAATLAATSTKKIKIGAGISLILQHDPITLAKQIATIDQVSLGRFVLGLGTGWIPEEMENHGFTYRARYRFIEEHLAAMKKIWMEEEPSFSGKFVNFSKLKSFPKPVQSPYPPLISGGSVGPKSLELIASHCDGWMPILGIPDWSKIKIGIEDLREMVEEIGKDIESIELSIFSWDLPDQETIEDMHENGIKRIVISLEGKNRDEALPLMDKYASAIT